MYEEDRYWKLGRNNASYRFTKHYKRSDGD